MHITTGRWKLGFALALVTATCWGVLTVALKIALQDLDPYTISWYRFSFAAVVLLTVLGTMGKLPAVSSLGRSDWVFLGVALLGLVGSYVLSLMGLHYITPTVVQVVNQLAPMFFLLGALVVYKESFSRIRWLGFALLVVGLLLFFNRKLPQLSNLSNGTGMGAALVLLGALSWATYGLLQKALLKRLGSQQILLLLYVGAILLLLPPASPATVYHASALALWMLAFGCLNTVVAYGAFAEALRHWDAARIGAVLAVTPLITLGTAWLTAYFFPHLVAPEGLDTLSIFGALMVVSGSALSALAVR